MPLTAARSSRSKPTQTAATGSKFESKCGPEAGGGRSIGAASLGKRNPRHGAHICRGSLLLAWLALCVACGSAPAQLPASASADAREEAEPASREPASAAERPSYEAVNGEVVLDARAADDSEAAALLRELSERDDFTFDLLGSMESRLARLGAVSEGDETDEDLAPVLPALLASGLTSRVDFATHRPGAVIRYRLITSSEADSAGALSNTTEELRIGYYYVWAERRGKASSDPKRRFRIVSKEKHIELEETE